MARTPDAVAAVFQDKSLTYAELNRRANQLAHHLISTGAGPETIVGIALERSLEMLVRNHRNSKAGAAYLPLDPAYPPERLAAMVEDANARRVITTAGIARTLSQNTPVLWTPTKPPSRWRTSPQAIQLTHNAAFPYGPTTSPMSSTSGSTVSRKGLGIFIAQ